MNNKQFKYLPYLGTDSYAYLGCTKEDIDYAIQVSEFLVKNGFRLFLNSFDKKELSYEQISESINKADSAIVFLSKEGIENLDFRNSINYLLSLNKKIIFIKIGNFELSHGLDMQLANADIISFTTAKDIASKIIDSVLTQDMIGEGMKYRVVSKTKYYIMALMAITVIGIFSIVTTNIIKERQTAEYILKDVDGYEYVNISSFGPEGIDALKGKSIVELDLGDAEYKNIDGIKDIKVNVVDVSDISEYVMLRPLKQVEGLETVKISQAQCKMAEELIDTGLRVIVTK